MKTPFLVYKPFNVPSINLTIQLPAKRWKKIQEYIRSWQVTQLCAVVNRRKQQPCVLEVLYTHTPALRARNASARTEGGREKFVMHLWAKPRWGHVNLALAGVRGPAIGIEGRFVSSRYSGGNGSTSFPQPRAGATPPSDTAAGSLSHLPSFHWLEQQDRRRLGSKPIQILVLQLDCQHNPNCYTSCFCGSHGLEIRPRLVSCEVTK